MRRTVIVAALVGCLACVAVAALAQGVLDLSWYTVDGGGGHSEGGRFAVNGTIGQPDAGVHEGGDFTVIGGFWPVALASPSSTATATVGPSPTSTRTPTTSPSPTASRTPTSSPSPTVTVTGTPDSSPQVYLPLIRRE